MGKVIVGKVNTFYCIMPHMVMHDIASCHMGKVAVGKVAVGEIAVVKATVKRCLRDGRVWDGS